VGIPSFFINNWFVPPHHPPHPPPFIAHLNGELKASSHGDYVYAALAHP